MKTINFQNLIQSVTGRNIIINTEDAELQNEKEYSLSVTFPITGIRSSFTWKTAKADEKLLRSFITAFTTKYREPNPASYNYQYGDRFYTWDEKTPEQKEQCIYHHRTHQYSKEDLMQQVTENFNKEGIQDALIKYGFYNTEYGIGIFCFFETSYVRGAIDKMKQFLLTASIPFANEYSDARWVYRFKLNLTKEQHGLILTQFNI
jgi:hypothetical protein